MPLWQSSCNLHPLAGLTSWLLINSRDIMKEVTVEVLYLHVNFLTMINYTEDSIRSLEWDEHIRLRPGMYIGKLGDGSSHDDGIYVLIKEIIDNSIDEFIMGNGKTIEVSINDKMITVRDFGRGIPLGKVVECVSRMNTGAKYEGKAFKKTVGLERCGNKSRECSFELFQHTIYPRGQIKISIF
jgi:topoisomerase IV subunit B